MTWGPAWSDKELELLVTLWPTSTAPMIMIQISRSRSAIISKANRMGLTQKPNGRPRSNIFHTLAPQEIRFIPGLTYPDIHRMHNAARAKKTGLVCRKRVIDGISGYVVKRIG